MHTYCVYLNFLDMGFPLFFLLMMWDQRWSVLLSYKISYFDIPASFTVPSSPNLIFRSQWFLPLNQFLVYHNIYVNAVMQGDVVSERWNTKFSVGRTVRLLHIIVFFQRIKVLYSLLRVTNFSIPTPLFTIVDVVMWGQENGSSIGEKEALWFHPKFYFWESCVRPHDFLYTWGNVHLLEQSRSAMKAWCGFSFLSFVLVSVFLASDNHEPISFWRWKGFDIPGYVCWRYCFFFLNKKLYSSEKE